MIETDPLDWDSSEDDDYFERNCQRNAADHTIPTWDADTPSPLVDLPPEILTEIFLLTIGTAHREVWRTIQPLIMVCHYWREVALHAPGIWRYLELRKSTSERYVRQFLKMSRHASLDINIITSPQTLDEVLIRPVSTEAHRIGSLRISGVHCDFGASDTGMDTVFDMPMLRRFIYSTIDNCAPPLISPNHPLPRLQVLGMTNVTFAKVVPYLRPTLTDLSILRYRMTFEDDGLPLATFLHALQGMPLLERLLLRDVSRGRHESSNEDGLPMITLARLKILEFSDHGRFIAIILHHLVVPASIFSRSRHRPVTSLMVTSVGDANDLDKLVSVFNAKLMGEGIIGSIDSRDVYLLFRKTPTGTALDMFSGAGSLFTHATAVPAAPLDILAQVCRSFNAKILARVSHVIIGNRFPQVNDDSAVKFQEVAKCLVGVHHVNLPGDSHLRTFVAAIRNSTDTALLPALQMLSAVRPCFRKCSPTAPDYVEDETDLVWSLRDMLRLRKKVGVPITTVAILGDPEHSLPTDTDLLGEFTEIFVVPTSRE
ncbi:hypothetical protein EIP91_011919 [Steccherinum ochraceum]|uniref:Uncharacterized protein n=1 Tax=Steccherinum ochraceum TaxID=92696 RepID=A0A4R0RHI0_9APHY|nr:hypothetical protein EIP91_011919 [Steccherinum ochraceum]